MISEKLAEILACPKCQSKEKMIIEEKSIKCASCKASYEVKNNIPLMTVKK